MFVLVAMILAVSIVNVQPKNPQVAFTANDPTGKLVDLSPLYRNVVLNTGGAYNAKTGRFVAPVSGLYSFSVTILVQVYRGNTWGTVFCYLLKSERRNPNIIVARVYSYRGQGDSASVMAFDHLSAGDHVHMHCYKWHLAKNSTFTGALITAD